MEGWKAERPYTVAASEGLDFHEWMENRPKSGSEKGLAAKLEGWFGAHPYSFMNAEGVMVVRRGFHRAIDYNGQRIIIEAHPDNLRMTYDARQLYVQVEEYKTVVRLDKEPNGDYGYALFKRSQAEFQGQLYRWVLGGILPDIQEEPYNDIILSVYTRRGGYLLKEYHITYMGDSAIEASIRHILNGWSKNRDPIAPKRWKCDVCDPGFKSRCRIAASNWTWPVGK